MKVQVRKLIETFRSKLSWNMQFILSPFNVWHLALLRICMHE